MYLNAQINNFKMILKKMILFSIVFISEFKSFGQLQTISFNWYLQMLVVVNMISLFSSNIEMIKEQLVTSGGKLIDNF